MALKFLIQFPIFSPPPDQSFHHRPATEVHFSRWNNNNDKYARQERTQKEIEDQLRFQKRFNSVDRIASVHNHIASPNPSFKSIGTPSAPSRPSIPGKKSKYSKPPDFQSPHPAFRRTVRPRKIPSDLDVTEAGVKVSDYGVSYVIPEAPFEFQYSYTETPKVKPVKLREPPIAPFGPGTMPRPWTGRKPLAPSKKKLEFDSFKLPPPHKKNVKPVQAPGPYLPGSGPQYTRSREEVLGEPLSKEEIEELVQSCQKSTRQLNMGRDGFTHNMLDNIHALWKRRRVCKIKCKGVCTVDMDNVRRQLEEKTGGKIIRSKGGIIYLFRGRNYNFMTRPRFPLMLWKPASPVYPRLVKRAPDGLTLDEANDIRKKGRDLIPICKLGKNGVYCNLVENVREAFEACELVRINCQGMNGSDYRKIGAKLKDLVPCVLISFEAAHILLWRGRDWKSSLPDLDDQPQVNESENGEAAAIACPPNLSTEDVIVEIGSKIEDVRKGEGEEISISVNNSDSFSTTESFDIPSCTGESSESLTENLVSTHQTDDQSESVSTVPIVGGISQDLSENWRNSNEIILSPQGLSENEKSSKEIVLSSQTEGVLLLLKQAVEGGSAIVLDDSCLDADTVFKKAVALAKSAPPGPAFRYRVKKAVTEKVDKLGAGEEEVIIVPTLSEKKKTERKSPSPRIQKKSNLNEEFLTVVPPGSLRVDELAKLLA